MPEEHPKKCEEREEENKEEKDRVEEEEEEVEEEDEQQERKEAEEVRKTVVDTFSPRGRFPLASVVCGVCGAWVCHRKQRRFGFCHVFLDIGGAASRHLGRGGGSGSAAAGKSKRCSCTLRGLSRFGYCRDVCYRGAEPPEVTMGEDTRARFLLLP